MSIYECLKQKEKKNDFYDTFSKLMDLSAVELGWCDIVHVKNAWQIDRTERKKKKRILMRCRFTVILPQRLRFSSESTAIIKT